MRRDFTPLWLFLLLAAFAAGGLLTAFPDSRLARRAESWPVAGPLVRQVRRLYQPPPPPPPPPEVEVVVLRRPRPAGSDLGFRWARPRIWVPPGTHLYAEPQSELPTVNEPVEIFNDFRYSGFIERRGDWYRLEWFDPQRGTAGGWVHLPGYREPTREELWKPAPVLPLPAEEADSAALERARRLMRSEAREHDCGPYRLLTDLAVAGLEYICAEVAGSLETVYPARYGVAPVSRPAGAVLAFARFADFAAFSREYRSSVSSHGFATPARGFVALPGGGDVTGRLVHELVHMLNRRALGPALPPWLEEGLAEDLAMSRLGPDGVLLPGTLGGGASQSGRLRSVTGGLAAVRQLKMWRGSGADPFIEQLLRFDEAEFRANGRTSLHYALSGLWVRYLVEGGGEELAEGFRSFLGAIAAGEPVAMGGLPQRLGRGWPELEAGFASWIRGLPAEGW